MAYEYRIQAIYKSHTPYYNRSYKGKVFTSEEEAKKLFNEAVDYYWDNFEKYLDHVEIQKREVSEWETSK